MDKAVKVNNKLWENKTMTVEPTTRRKCAKGDIIVGNQVLEEVTVYKYLGVHVDCDLNFKSHIKGVIKNVAHKVSLLSKIRKYLTVKASKLVYKTMILPLIDVGDFFYNSAGSKYKSKLQTLQNRALRVIYKMERRTTTDQAHNDMEMLKLQERRCLHLLQIAKWMAENPNNRDTRNLSTRAHATGRKNIRMCKPNSQRYLQSYHYKASGLRNSLLTVAHNIRESDKFKKIVTEYIKAGSVSLK